jgi:hypothetical protein
VKHSAEIQHVLRQLLRNGLYKQLAAMEPPSGLSGAELTVIRFRADGGSLYYAFNCTSVEVRQGPCILDAFESVE